MEEYTIQKCVQIDKLLQSECILETMPCASSLGLLCHFPVCKGRRRNLFSFIGFHKNHTCICAWFWTLYKSHQAGCMLLCLASFTQTVCLSDLALLLCIALDGYWDAAQLYKHNLYHYLHNWIHILWSLNSIILGLLQVKFDMPWKLFAFLQKTRLDK